MISPESDFLLEDLCPFEGGSGGGKILAEGTPEKISKVKNSFTGKHLLKVLNLKNKIKNKKISKRNLFGFVENTTEKFLKILKNSDIWDVSIQKQFIDMKDTKSKCCIETNLFYCCERRF